MTLLFNRTFRLLFAAALSVYFVEIGWVRMNSLVGLLIAWVLGVVVVAWALRDSAPWAKPPLDFALPDAPARWPGLFNASMSILGVVLLIAAWRLALADKLGGTLICLVAIALVWRPVLDMRTEPGLSPRWLAGLMLVVMLAGGLLRFYRFGDIPAGLLTVDEPRLIAAAQTFLDGFRETFNVAGGVGRAPYWVEATAMWAFGSDITGFRMSAGIPGFFLVGFVGLLALELAGSRIGLLAAAFTALCVWPVTFSRQEYIIASSLAPMVAAPWLFMRGLRRGGVYSMVLGGFCLGLCFILYNPSRMVPLLVFLLGLFLWIRRSSWRNSLHWALLPVIGGMVVGLAPLLLWAGHGPDGLWRGYFGNLDLQYMAGRDVVQAQGILAKFDVAFGRIMPNLSRIFTMFTTHGGMRPWFFKLDQPVIDQATLFLCLSGLAVSLTRFRQAAFAFIVTWWLLGLTPTLLADPGVHMDERRIMLALPATMLLAAVGFHGLFRATTWGMDRKRADKFLVILSVLFFSALAVNSWRTYFYDIEMDRHRLEFSHANFDQMTRGIFKQNSLSPVNVLSFRKPAQDQWYGANYDNELVEHWTVLGKIPRRVASTDAAYLLGDGFIGQLRKMATDKKDPLIILTPFHYYLQPMLERVGAVLVDDIPPVMSKDGPVRADVGFAWDPKSATRIMRFKDFKPEHLAPFAKEKLFPYTVEELTPPPEAGSRSQLGQSFLLNPDALAATENYINDRAGWKAVSKKADFSLPDPWFWTTAGRFPYGIRPPLRMRAKWSLRIPVGGEYAFGASSNFYTDVKIDGKRVFEYKPRGGAKGRANHEKGLNGWMAPAVTLAEGEHTLEFEQLTLGYSGNFNQLIRLLWQAPGGQIETLPLAVLAPLPSE